MFEITDTMPPKLKTEERTLRVQIVAPESWVKRVEEFRSQERSDVRIPNASSVIRTLVDEALDIRDWPKALRDSIDEWRAGQQSAVSQSEAIRRLVEVGIRAERKRKEGK